MDAETRNLLQETVRGYLAEAIGEPLTEPLRVSELAGLFDVNRDTMRQALERMEGVQRFGSRFQVPVRRMPVRYWIDRRLLPECRKLPETAGS